MIFGINPIFYHPTPLFNLGISSVLPKIPQMYSQAPGTTQEKIHHVFSKLNDPRVKIKITKEIIKVSIVCGEYFGQRFLKGSNFSSIFRIVYLTSFCFFSPSSVCLLLSFLDFSRFLESPISPMSLLGLPLSFFALQSSDFGFLPSFSPEHKLDSWLVDFFSPDSTQKEEFQNSLHFAHHYSQISKSWNYFDFLLDEKEADLTSWVDSLQLQS